MALTREEVQKIAHLARLALTEAEQQVYQRQLSDVLDYAAMLDTLDLSGVEPTAHAIMRENVMRADVVEPGLDIEDVLFNSAQNVQDQFLIQSVLEE